MITKTRCPKLSGAVLQKPGADLAGILKEWLAVAPAQAAATAAPAPQTGSENGVRTGRTADGRGDAAAPRTPLRVRRTGLGRDCGHVEAHVHAPPRE